MLGIADAHPAAMMDRYPGRSRSSVEQRIEQRPVRHRIRAVAHRLGLPVGASHRAGIEVVAPDHHRRLELAPPHHLVEGEAEPVALPETDPADARRQTLKRDLLARHVEPVMEMRIIWNE